MADKVWTERRVGSWDQCTECAYLMALIHGGFNDFPLGAYTGPERDALDAATPPDPPSGGSTFTLIDAGSKKRYGLALPRIPDGSRAGLASELRKKGQSLAVAGNPGNLPDGHRLRRWQPGFEGGHAICVVALGDGKVRWLDPLAPNGFEGDVTSVDNVLTFAWIPSDARIGSVMTVQGGEDPVKIAELEAALAECRRVAESRRKRIIVLEQRRDGLTAQISELEDQMQAIIDAHDLSLAEQRRRLRAVRARLAEVKAKIAALATDVADD